MAEPILKAGYWHLTPLLHTLSPTWWTSDSGGGIEDAPGMEWLKGRVRRRETSSAEKVVQPRMVFELEPNVCRGRHRINIGGTVIVTKDGVEELNKLPTQMWVL